MSPRSHLSLAERWAIKRYMSCWRRISALYERQARVPLSPRDRSKLHVYLWYYRELEREHERQAALWFQVRHLIDR